MLLANCLAGIAGILAAVYLAPRIAMVWMVSFEPTNTSVLGLMTALVILPGVVGGTSVAVGHWLIDQFRKDGKGQ